MSQGDKDQQKPLKDQAAQSMYEETRKETLAEETVDLETANKETVDSQAQISEQVKPARKRGKSGFFIFVFILILLAFAGGGYGAYYYLNGVMLERESALNDGLQKIEDGFNVLEKADQELNRKQGDLQRTLTAAVVDVEDQMGAMAERISVSESTDPADWTLAEVEYLLRIANQRLITSGDHKTAIEMLQSADSILKELAYPELAVVRRQLAADLTELQMANQVDVDGVYFALESMSSEVAKLDQFAPEEVAPIELARNEETLVLMSIWNRVVQLLSGYIRIDTDAGEPKYLITDEQEIIRRTAIQLQLRQAQLALLSSRQEIYSASLSGAAESVDIYYDAGNLAKSLEDLSTQQIDQQALDVNGSIRILSEVIDQLSKMNSPAVKRR